MSERPISRTEVTGTAALAALSGKRRPLSFPILGTLVRRWLVDRHLRNSHCSIRTTSETDVERAYRSLSVDDFDALNAPQRWLNARLIPRALRAHAAAGPLRIVDLGCGSGDSTQVLARWAPRGSRVLGYDLSENLLAQARQRTWRAATGEPLATVFIRQSMLEPLRDADHVLLPPGSVDVVHAAGVVGHHLREHDVVRLASELRRVLAPNGIAVLDSGPMLPPDRLRRLMEVERFDITACYRLLPFTSRSAMVFRRSDLASERG